jgi:hypothetical protein
MSGEEGRGFCNREPRFLWQEVKVVWHHKEESMPRTSAI